VLHMDHFDFRLWEETLRPSRKVSSITPALCSIDAVSAHSRARRDSTFVSGAKEWNVSRANFEEADDGSSARDKVAKWRIVLRELKETRFRLRILRRCGFLTESQDPVINETIELIKIVSTIIGRNNGPDSAKA
jgi:23S rRNA-intervening sequence protein